MSFKTYMLLLVSIICATNGDCMPECRYACSDPVCNPVCGPSCAEHDCAPLCEAAPPGPCSSCEVVCEPPVCIQDCGRNETTNEYSVADQCTLEQCPTCETVCEPEVCQYRNCRTPIIDNYCADVMPTCETHCSPTNCDWVCEPPSAEDCPLPECVLQCESPACECGGDDCSILAHYQETPPTTHQKSTGLSLHACALLIGLGLIGSI